MRSALVALVVCCAASSASAEKFGACRFDPAAMSFDGEPLVQARCLLRFVAKFGQIAQEPAQLPASLNERIGNVVELDRKKLGARLVEAKMPNEFIRLDAPVSRGSDNARNAPLARYFVIHDTSSPWFGDRNFPDDVNTSDEVNDMETLRVLPIDIKPHRFDS